MTDTPRYANGGIIKPNPACEITIDVTECIIGAGCLRTMRCTRTDQPHLDAVHAGLGRHNRAIEGGQ